ncbi:alginate lyase family protein [Myxococcus sp. 1LA]
MNNHRLGLLGLGLILWGCGGPPLDAEGEDAALLSETEQAIPAAGGGIFVSAADLSRARQRAASNTAPFAENARILKGRADGALNTTPRPFRMTNISAITYHWCSTDNDGIDNSLADATNKFQDDGDRMRTLALQYALSGDTRYASRAALFLMTWAAQHTPVNLHDLGVDYARARLNGQTEGFCSNRPWNFALDGLFQTYGLINASDAYVLLKRNGYALSAADDTAVREWLRKSAEAVNSSFQAWTRWADANPNSSAFARYRSDNHLSWALAGLLAASVALQDEALAKYVLDGTSWTDRRNGAYANPSHVKDVINRAIESGTGAANEGRIYEEKILRDPAIGYSLYHLWALSLIAQTAEVNYARPGFWSHVTPNGGSIRKAYDRYTAFILGERPSPQAGEGPPTSYSWLYEMAYDHWPEARFRTTILAAPQPPHHPEHRRAHAVLRRDVVVRGSA